MTLNLDHRLIAKLRKVAGVRTRAEAIHLAAKAFLDRRAVEGIRALRGKVPLVDNWRTLREMEKDEA